MSLPLLLAALASLVPAQLEIRACCGTPSTNCKTFSRPEDLFGTACCANNPYNSYTELCCSGSVRDRRRGGAFAELCCGTEVLRYDQTCCDGVVHNVVNGDCCGKAVFSKAERNFLCCNGSLVRTTRPTDVCCGADVYDGGKDQICCGNLVFEAIAFDSCCEKNDGTHTPFKSSAQFCCDGTQPKGQNMSCCYLRTITGILQPTPYNSNQQCCKYPYNQLTSPNIDGSCA